MEQTTLPIPPDVFWPIAYIIGFVLAVLLILVLMPKTTDDPSRAQRWIEAFKKDLDLSRIKTPLVVLGLFFWALLTATLVLGLLWQISSLAFQFSFESADATRRDWELRGRLIAITALTATLGAVIALPVTLRRLKLTRQQTRISEETLFNEKITEVTRDLYAQRQVTRDTDDPKNRYDAWEDDIIRRNVAIDQLERLVEERPETAFDIARVLTVYVRELSKEFRPVVTPSKATPHELRGWSKNLIVQRSEMEKAVKALVRLKRLAHKAGDFVQIDLGGCNLQAMGLRQLDFSDASLKEAHSQGANLMEAQLQRSDLSGAQMQGTYLSRAQLQKANLSGAKLQGADLIEAQLKGAYLSTAQLQEAYLIGAQMQGTNLIRAKVQAGKLIGAHLQRANLRRAQIQRANLSKVQMQEADLREAQMQESILSDAQMQRADLREAQMQESILSDAQMQRADLRGTQLQEADLSGAQLQGADLRGTQLYRADLSGAQLQGSDLSGAQLHSADLSAANLRGAALRYVYHDEIVLSQDQVNSLFGDTTVKLSPDIEPPEWFSQSYDDWDDFWTAWRAWQKEIGFDPDDPSTW